MFIDKAKIKVFAGKGGNGVNSFYRDKYIPKGRPDGGDGGRGGDVVFQASRHMATLLDFRYRQHFSAAKGEHGSGKNKKGKDGVVLIVKVPVGTVIKDVVSGFVLSDLKTEGQKVYVAKGGAGGRGNKPFKPATQGEAGETLELLLELKLIADVGIVGFPNAGKSTLISKISGAHPDIANYPFTTKHPVLGVVKFKDKTYVFAEIPGIIKDAHKGAGLGLEFLRHAERTKLILHLLDMASTEGRDPVDDFFTINHELESYSPNLAKKPQIVAANKMDLEGALDNLQRFTRQIGAKVFAISAAKSHGLKELLNAISKKLQAHSN